MTFGRALSAVAYTDSSLVTVPETDDRSVLEWARAIFEHAPPALRTGLPRAS